MNERDGPGICRRWQLIVAVCGFRDRPLNYVILSEADVILSEADVILSEAKNLSLKILRRYAPQDDMRVSF